MKQVRITEAFIFAYETIKKYPMLLLAPPIILSLVSNTLGMFLNTSSKLFDLAAIETQADFLEKFGSLIPKSPFSNTLLAILVSFLVIIVLLFIIVAISLGIGRIRIAIHAFDQKEEEPTWRVYNNLGKGIIGKYFWAVVLLVLIVLGGLILLVVPGIILSIMYQFVLLILVEKDVRISEAFHRSDLLTNGIKWQLFGFALLVNFLVLIIMIPISILEKTGLNFLYFPLNVIVTPIIGVFTLMTSIFIYKDLSVQEQDLLGHREDSAAIIEEIEKSEKN